MRYPAGIVIGVIAVLGSACASPPPPREPAPPPPLQLPLPVAHAGERVVSTTDMTFAIEVAQRGKPARLSSRLTQERADEVLAVEDGRPTRLRVTYRQRREPLTTGDHVENPKDPLEGHTYVVELATATVLRADGAALDADERQAVLDDLGGAGEDTLAAALARAPLRPGVRMPLTESEALALVGEASSFQGDAGLTLRDVAGGRATLALDARGTVMVDALDNEPATLVLDGSVVVEVATGRPLSLELDGTFTGRLLGNPATATLRLRVRWDR